MFLEFLILFFIVFFWGSPIGISTFLGHLGAALICLVNLKDISKYYIVWVILLVALFTAQEVRFSVEYVLLAMTFLYLGASPDWKSNESNIEQQRKKILFYIFFILMIFGYFRIDLSERGSLLLWLPVYLVLYFNGINIRNFLVYFFSGFALFFSNKLTTLLAFVISLRSKPFYLLSIFLVPGYFIYRQNFSNFITKSIEPRIYIWKSIFVAFFDKPLFGHGFGTFALDFPLYRAHGQVLGGRIGEQVVHGHNLFSHYLFEGGLIGLLLIFGFFYLLYINVPRVILPLFVICLFDSPLVTFNQFGLAGLLIIPFIRKLEVLKCLFSTVSNKYFKIMFFVSIFIIYLLFFVPSLVGHYFYDKKNIDMAIKWDAKNSLYYFTRGGNLINKDIQQSEKDFLKAIELSPSVSYFYGFLGAAQLANNKITDAKKNIEEAMKLDGKDGYWCLLYAYANYNDKKVFDEYQKKALKKNPEIKEILSNPNVRSAKYIGNSKYGDPRLAGFYRTGETIYFPLPIIR